MVRVDGDDNGGTSLIRVRGLDKTYRRGSEEIHVLQGLNLDVDAGDFVAFMGPSGSGKTTLLNLLGGLDVPSAGSITVAGDEITAHVGPQADRLARAPRGVRLPDVQPHPGAHRLPERRAAASADQPLHAERRASRGDGLDRRGPGRSHAPLPPPAFRRPGAARGHRARARRRSRPSSSATNRPATWTARARDEILDLLAQLVREYGKTVLMVTHDPRAAERADVVLHLDKGVLVEGAKAGRR